MCRNSVVEEKIVEKVSTFIKVDDSNFNSRRRQIDPRLKRNARIILESQPQITTEQDLANYLLRFVLEGNCSFYLLAIAKLLNDKYLKLFSFYFQTLIENHQLQLLNARHHLSAYLDEVCYWQALKIYDQLQQYNYNLEKNEIFLIARAVAAHPEKFNKYDPSKASLKTFAGKVIHGKVLDQLRKGREKEKYSPTGLLRNITRTELKNSLSQAISHSSEIERCLLAWQCFNEIYVPTRQQGNRTLEPPSNEQLEDIAQLYERRSSATITSNRIEELLDTCVQAIRQASLITIESLDVIDIEKHWENTTKNHTTDEGEYLELHQQIQEVLVNKFLSFPDNFQKMLELKFGLNITQQEVADYFLNIHYTNVGKKVKKYIKELSLAFSKELSLTLSSEELNRIREYIVQFLKNYCTDKFGDFLSKIICQKSSKIINLSKVVDGKYYGNIQKTPKNIKVSKIEKNNNNELVVGDEYNLNNNLEKVKQKLQNELETYVANNYSILLLESQSVKKKIAYLIEKYLEKYTYTNIH
jgi:RNA polymerase sigma factor (sigma-70 family)